MIKRLSCIICIMLLLVSLSACGNNQVILDDILTQKITGIGRTQISVLVKYAFSINTFEKEVEKKFPKIDIVQVGNFTPDMGISEYEARLKNDDLTDLTMSWPLDVGKEYWSERLIELSGLTLTNKYKKQMLDSVKTKNGEVYYLPGPSQVRGIVYNKTLFNENQWTVPANFEEFIKLCHDIESNKDSNGKPKIRSLQLGLGNSEVLDTAFVGYGYNQGFCSPKNASWLQTYNSGVGNFIDNFKGSLETFQRLIDENILIENDLNVHYQDRELDLFTRKCAMIEDSVLMAQLGESQTGTQDEFALMPFFNPTNEANLDSDWARIYPVCYIGANKHLEESKNKQKYDLVMQLLEYISTTEGQEALTGDTGGMFSSLNDVPLSSVPELMELNNALDHGRYANFPVLKNAQNALRDGLADMVRGVLTLDEVAAKVDAQNIQPPIVTPPIPIGNADKSFTLLETGNFITDIMRKEGDCDIALFLDNGKDGRYNGKGVSAKFYKGAITKDDINRIMPDFKKKEKCVLWKVAMTGEDIVNALEYTLPVYNNIDGWFYYFSGIRVEYSPTAEPGSRVEKITDLDGKPFDLKQIYSVAVCDYSVKEEYTKSCEITNISIRTILEESITRLKTITPSNDKRFKILP